MHRLTGTLPLILLVACSTLPRQTNEDYDAPGADAFIAWARPRAIALPDDGLRAAPAQLGRLEAVIGSAQVLALGEHAHGAHEPLEFRNRLFRDLVERLGFTAIALESGLSESRRIHDFVMGSGGEAREIVRTGLTWGFGDYAENLELIRWLRHINAGREQSRKVRFYGIDVSGGEGGELPGARIALRDALTYLARVAPRSTRRLRGAAESFLASFTHGGYASLSEDERERLHNTVESVITFFETERQNLLAASSQDDFEWGYRNAVVARQIAGMFRVWPEETPQEGLAPELYKAVTARDAAMADNLLWALQREGPSGRILLFAHNAHVANAAARGGVSSVYPQPPTMMGQHLRRSLAEDLLIVLTSSASDGSDLPTETAGPGTMDAALSRVGLPPFLLDIRQAQPRSPVALWLNHDQSVRANFTTENVLKPLEAFDAVVYFDHLTPSDTLADGPISPRP